jgi:hypothetical protein
MTGLIAVLSAANLLKRLTGHNLKYGISKTVTVSLLRVMNAPQNRLIGKLNRSTKGIPKEFAIELLDEVVATVRFDVSQKISRIAELMAIR